MKIFSLAVEQIRQQNSDFYLIKKRTQNDFYPLLAQSLSEIGFLQPLLVYQAQQGIYHLLDGFYRLVWAKKQSLATVPCQILLKSTPLTTLFQLLLIQHYSAIQANLVERINFIALALRQGMDRQVLCYEFLPRLGFQGHERVLRQCEAISHLPEEVLDFCREKNFAMRQCLALTQQPEVLLQQMMSWRKELNLTASIIEELFTHIKDLLRNRSQDITTFIANPEINNILNSDLSKQEKTHLLRQLLKNWRYPILNQTHNHLQTIYQKIPLPKQTHLKWDESLECKELILQLKVRSVEQWQQRVAGLQDQRITEGIEQLLAQL